MKLLGNGGVRALDSKDRYKARHWQLWQYVEVEGVRQMRTRNVGGKRSKGITLNQARLQLSKFRDELAQVVPNRDTFREYVDKWLQWRADSGTIEPTTLDKNRRAAKVLCMEFGDDRMEDLTPGRCRDGLSAIMHGNNPSGKELSGSYMNSLHKQMSIMLKQAAEDGRIAANPLANVKPPRIDTREKKALTAAQHAALLDALDDMPLDGRVAAIYVIATLGLRRGEACALALEDVDLAANVVKIRRAVKESAGTVGSPKTRAGVRSLPMPARLSAFLRRWIPARNALYGEGGTLCCSSVGGLLYPQRLDKWWRKNRADLGADGYSLHELRHTNLTLMAGSFGSPYHLMRWAGWSDAGPTRTYIHEDLSGLIAAVQAMDNAG